MRVTLAGGAQPSAPIKLRFDLSDDPELAGSFSDVIKPLVRTISDGDATATDFLAAEWDPVSRTVTATTTHLSVFQVIATDVGQMMNAVADAWKQVAGQADSSCRGKSEATIGGTKLTLTPSKAGPVAGCLRGDGDGKVGIEFTNGTRQYYGVTSTPAGQFTNPPLTGGDETIATWLHHSLGTGGLLTPRSSGTLVLPAGTTSGAIHLDVDPVALQLKTVFAGIGMLNVRGDQLVTAFMDTKEAWDCFTTVANVPTTVLPGNVIDFRNTLVQLAQCGLTASGKAVADPKFVLHRMGVGLSLLTTLPDQFLANVTGAIGEVSGDNHLTFTLTGAGESPTTSSSQAAPPSQSAGSAIDRVDVTTWAYNRVEGDTYVADNTGGKKIEVFWKSFAGTEQVSSGCKSTVQIDGPATSQTKEVPGCDSYNSGTYLDVRSPGTYTVTVTVHQAGQSEIRAQRTVTVLPKGSR
ncbi:MAG TPA: hypothetical protein PLI79_09045 [Mycobacterium sp.]|nr:hypothetical protein [Mycobacterium sp.]